MNVFKCRINCTRTRIYIYAQHKTRRARPQTQYSNRIHVVQYTTYGYTTDFEHAAATAAVAAAATTAAAAAAVEFGADAPAV
eukprot:COSAG05_NODE_1903_length_3854_cov_12.540613_2_plen_82_part_00